MNFKKLTTTTAVTTMLLAASSLAHAMNPDAKEDDTHASLAHAMNPDAKKDDAHASLPHSVPSTGWNEADSMTPALDSRIFYMDPSQELVGAEGPSPSNLAILVMLLENGPHVLMCKDYDPRRGADGELRPTSGALKASFGFTLSKDHKFQNSVEALRRGPANESLYNLFNVINPKNIITPEFVHFEESLGWGPAVNVPQVVKGADGAMMKPDESEGILTYLNEKARQQFEEGKAESTDPTRPSMKGRFRDFMYMPLELLQNTGSLDPAVRDEDKFLSIEVNGETVRLWDEGQMRHHLIPALRAFTDRFYGR